MDEIKYSIVIPTRNRPQFLEDLLKTINMSAENLIEILIIDSSDSLNNKFDSNISKIKYIHTKIKSAAIQRNIGIDKVSTEAKFIFFLDDDVLIDADYFGNLIESINESGAIGASGIAINLNNYSKRKNSTGLTGLFKKFFLLDSNIEGKLLKSAINIPCKLDSKCQSSLIEVDWLIGCAAWRSSAFTTLRFEESFNGQSLGEDLLFSNKAKNLGKIVVNKNVIINHRESDIERPNPYNFYKMWVLNRYKISNQLNLSPLNLAFHWANFGTLVMNIVKKQKNYSVNIRILLGIMSGYKEILKG
jgi:GT2 family glycosyltransferase